MILDEKKSAKSDTTRTCWDKTSRATSSFAKCFSRGLPKDLYLARSAS